MDTGVPGTLTAAESSIGERERELGSERKEVTTERKEGTSSDAVAAWVAGASTGAADTPNERLSLSRKAWRRGDTSPSN
jgi:hypothetical protein